MAGLLNVDVGNLAGGLFGLVDKLFTSEQERAEVKRKIVELQQKGELAQIALNAVEARHESLFVAGWRPAIGWICGAAFAYSFVVQPFLAFVVWATATDPTVTKTLPDLDLSMMMPVLLGMLGLGGLRTYEKRTGTNLNRFEQFMAAPMPPARPSMPAQSEGSR